MKPAPNLRAVPQSVESRLRALFSREDELLAELAQVRAEQRLERNAYATAHGLLLRPSLDQIRKVLS